MIQLQQITLQRGHKVLLDHASLTLHPRQKIGIVGPNGAGKTSLFMLIQEKLEVEQGEVVIPKGVRLAHIEQQIPSGSQATIDYVCDGDADYADLQKKLLSAESDNDGMEISRIHARLAEIDGYSIPSMASKILIGLGFSQQELTQPIDSFSGGWRMRMNLARVLMVRSDVLLLDEPTNHLDLDAIMWLEEFLQQVNQTVLLISHDRAFLDKVTNHTVHFFQKKLNIYTGNYSAFERSHIEALRLQQATFEKQKKAKDHLQSYVDRFRFKASKAKQAQSRLKMIEKMDIVAQVHESSPFQFEFKKAKRAGNPMVRTHKADIGYDENIILNKINFAINDGDRIGLIGPNGAGKSTLIKVLAKSLNPTSGEFVYNPDLKIGYFAQYQLEHLDLDEGPLWHLKRIDESVTDKEGRQYLGGFNFRGDDAFRPVRNFSGGEKARLVMALLIWQSPNFLLLDEPTNHLDMEVREALALALQSYEGAMVIVSHDRYLLNAVTDELWLVSDGAVSRFDGDLDDYRDWLRDSIKTRLKQEASAKKIDSNKKQLSNSDIAIIERKIKHIETQIDRLQLRLSEVDEKLAEPGLYCDSRKQDLDALTKKREKIASEIESKEDEMLDLMQDL